MSEAEFNLLLDVVRTVVEPAPEYELVQWAWRNRAAPTAANDNDQVWPLLPFPDDWYASN